MLQTVFPEENADDPFASIIAKQPKIIDHNLRLEKNMTAKQKWKTARLYNFKLKPLMLVIRGNHNCLEN